MKEAANSKHAEEFTVENSVTLYIGLTYVYKNN